MADIRPGAARVTVTVTATAPTGVDEDVYEKTLTSVNGAERTLRGNVDGSTSRGSLVRTSRAHIDDPTYA
jgi:hypothetical protein